jgi:hypothetical protein
LGWEEATAAIFNLHHVIKIATIASSSPLHFAKPGKRKKTGDLTSDERGNEGRKEGRKERREGEWAQRRKNE